MALDKNTEDLIKRDCAAQYLQAWNRNDLDRLSIEGLKIETGVIKEEKVRSQQY